MSTDSSTAPDSEATDHRERELRRDALIAELATAAANRARRGFRLRPPATMPVPREGGRPVT